MGIKNPQTRKNAALEILLWLMSLAVIVPLLIALLGSFKDRAEASYYNIALPKQWRFENYWEVIKKSNLGQAFFNSLIITGGSAGLIILLSAACSFVLSRRSTYFTRFINTFFSLGIIVPLSIIPAILVMKSMALLNSRHGIILLYVGYKIAWSIFLLTGFIEAIPRDIDGAAIVDGCSPLQLLLSVIFPQLKPIVMTNIIIVAISIWNDFQLPFYFLSSSSMRTMPLTIYNFFGQYVSYWNLVFADVVLISVPIIILYIFCQKYIVAGMTAGAVKG